MSYCRELKHRQYGMVHLRGQMALRSRTRALCIDVRARLWMLGAATHGWLCWSGFDGEANRCGRWIRQEVWLFRIQRAYGIEPSLRLA
jgi:hypothetical protein